jgi:hypothetical protein
LTERERRTEEQSAALAELIRFQDELPAAWKEDAAWDLPEPDVSPIPMAWHGKTVRWDLNMDPMPAERGDLAIDLWRLRRNLELSPEERLERLRRWLQWMAQYRGAARSAIGPRPEATGH